MKFPTIEEMARDVAEKALDEYEYNGKTIREWIEIILATASEDKISGRAAVNAMNLYCKNTCPIRENMWCSDCQIEELKKIVLGSATDINVATKDGTNLAEVGTDCISRRAAINAIDECYSGGEDSCGEPWIYKENAVEAINMIEPIPPAEPQIVRCKDCKHLYKDGECPLRTWYTHVEDDFCSYAERKTE